MERYDTSNKVCVVCGTGNNGGDGLGIALLLHEWNYRVEVFVVRGGSTSPDFDASLKLLNRPILMPALNY